MATINYFTETDIPLSSIGSPDNTSCTNGVSCTIGVQVTSICGAAIDTVTFFYGDGSSAAATDGGGGAYSASNTYASAGAYGFYVVVAYVGTATTQASPLTTITVS